MASTHRDIANAVVTRLSSGSYGQSFTPTLELMPVIERQDESGLSVRVYLGGETQRKLSRSDIYERDYDVIVLVRKTKDVDTSSGINTELTLVENIKDDLEGAGKMNGYTLTQVSKPAPFDVDTYLAEGVFQASITLTYRGIS